MNGPDRIYETVNERILAALRKGVVPWKRPWTTSDPFMHRNAASGHVYRGVNVFLLMLTQLNHGYSRPRWLTFKQARNLGGTVRFGERGTPVVFWNVLTRERAGIEGQPEMVKVPLLRQYTVFNVDQTEGVDPDRLVPLEPVRDEEFKPLERAQPFLRGYEDGPTISHGGDQAYWAPFQDRIVLPRPGQFHSAHAYYGTLFHELVHSTGHPKRLDRDSIHKMAHFGDALYGREELVAEMGSAFLQASVGIEDQVEASAAYLQNWMNAIDGDLKLLVVAAAQAQKAADWVRGLRPAVPTEQRVQNQFQHPVAAEEGA